MEKYFDPKTITIWLIIIINVLITLSIIKLVRINFKRLIDSKLKHLVLQKEYQKKLIETSIITQERERSRIAADLHDSLIGRLTILRLKNQLEYNYEEMDTLLEESIDEARFISHDLYPPMLEFIKLAELIGNIIGSWKKHFKIFFFRTILSDVLLSSSSKIQIARIVQELIVNIHKHAHAESAFVHLKITKKNIILIVSDNGKGFSFDEVSTGIGLKNIELRVLNLNGSHKIKSSKRGTTAIAVFDPSKFNAS